MSSTLVEAARVGGLAPSVHNTQPWRWTVRGDVLELRAVRDRQLSIGDPVGRLLTISCGAALHHARVSLAAQGVHCSVDRFPAPDDPNLLARVTLMGSGEPSEDAARALEAIRSRHTDRRPVSATPVDRSTVDDLALVAMSEGAHLHILRPDDVLELAAAAAHAQQVEDLDPEWIGELSYWARSTPQEGLGLIDAVLPEAQPQTTVPERDFGHTGTLAVGGEEQHDKTAMYAILYGDEDTPDGWLHGGEALSAIWVSAVEQHLTVLPLSAAVEVAQTRMILRQLLANLGEPFLVLRLGVGRDDAPEVPHTPRLPENETIDVR